MSRYLAIDQGGHASRAIVFDASGQPEVSAEHPIATRRPTPDQVEHDPEEIIGSVRHALQALGRPPGTRINAAGLATQRSSIVCWDRVTGEALSPVISWQDRRAAETLIPLASEQADIHRRTGLMLTPHYGASKLRWCLDHLPAVARAGTEGRLAFGPLASFLLFRLLDEQPLVADPANAQRTQLWNLATRDWDDILLDRFGIPRACLPACVPTHHAFGSLRVVGRTVPLRICQGDQPAALFADGMPQPDCAYINIGTGAFAQRVFPEPLAHAGLLTSLVWQQGDERTYVLEGTVNGAGAALDWIAARHAIAEIASELPGWLSADTTPLLFLNGIGGLGAPYWVANFESSFLGAGTVAQQVVGVAESILFLLQVNIDELAGAGRSLARIVMTGGLSQLDGLCQRMADLSGLPVWRPDVPEATARGLACLVAGFPRSWSVADGESFAPRPNDGLHRRYSQWRQAMAEAAARANA
ncbi:MAG: hypothetical protein AMJ72_12465 [Acidithiobacillales bacterium SM1_46]|nr:MAG: hypothetical protein AMJ72_12465 [Acidithiobacillales bacterium SM1_46]